jgi:hypothetical protein
MHEEYVDRMKSEIDIVQIVQRNRQSYFLQKDQFKKY